MAQEVYYLVKSVFTATEENKNFPGQVVTTIHGKENQRLYMDGSYKKMSDFTILYPGMVRMYGYKNKRDAARNWSYKNPENSQFWTTEVEIVQVWVRHDGKVMFIPNGSVDHNDDGEKTTELDRMEVRRINDLVGELQDNYDFEMKSHSYLGAETMEAARINGMLKGISALLDIIGYTLSYTDDGRPYIEQI